MLLKTVLYRYFLLTSEHVYTVSRRAVYGYFRCFLKKIKNFFKTGVNYFYMRVYIYKLYKNDKVAEKNKIK